MFLAPRTTALCVQTQSRFVPAPWVVKCWSTWFFVPWTQLPSFTCLSSLVLVLLLGSYTLTVLVLTLLLICVLLCCPLCMVSAIPPFFLWLISYLSKCISNDWWRYLAEDIRNRLSSRSPSQQQQLSSKSWGCDKFCQSLLPLPQITVAAFLHPSTYNSHSHARSHTP